MVKKVPMRQCSGCSERKTKKDLVRIVKKPEGEIVLDLTGKVSGRGAYICPNAECLKKARKAGRLERSLSSQIPQEVYTKLEEELENGS